MSSASTATPLRLNFFTALLLLVLISCSGGSSYSLVLILKTADGLEAGDPVIRNGKEVGRIVRVEPVVGEVEALAQFENDFVPSRTARFELADREGGRRSIRIVDERPSAVPMPSGGKAVVRLSPETEEDRLWISR